LSRRCFSPATATRRRAPARSPRRTARCVRRARPRHEGRDDQRELAAGKDRAGEVGGADAIETAQPRHDHGAQCRGEHGDDDREHDRPRDFRQFRWVDHDPERKEEEGCERVADRPHECFDPADCRCLRENQARHQCTDRFGDTDVFGDARDEEGEPDEADRQQLVVVARDEPRNCVAAEASDEREREQERERLADREQRRARAVVVLQNRLEDCEIERQEDCRRRAATHRRRRGR
jgi:hypothetical protein